MNKGLTIRMGAIHVCDRHEDIDRLLINIGTSRIGFWGETTTLVQDTHCSSFKIG